jgi:sigma-B regulation protein RsbU (phosphoserine phosphatase)
VPPLLGDGDASHEAVDLDSTAPPIGLFATTTFESSRIRLEPGSSLLLFSDGVSEAANDGDEEFGRDRLRQILRVHRDRSASALCEATIRAVVEYGRGRPQFDDLTVVAARAL